MNGMDRTDGLRRSLIIVALLLFGAAPWAAASGAPFTRISPERANNMLKSGEIDLLLDVRTLKYYTGPSGRLKGAFLAPIDKLPEMLDTLKKFKDKTILVYCEVGIWSQDAARLLGESGFGKVLELEGGIERWTKEGYPVIN